MLDIPTSAFAIASPAVAERGADELRELADQLERLLETSHCIWHGDSGRRLLSNGLQPFSDQGLCAELVRETARQAAPRFIGEAGVVVVFAIPLETSDQTVVVAIGCHALQHVASDEPVEAEARILGLDVHQARRWINDCTVWSARDIERTGTLLREKLLAESRCQRLTHEISQLSDNLSVTYEEISLLCGITQRLNLERSEEELARLALEWLLECIPAECIAIEYLPVAEAGETTYAARSEPMLITAGQTQLEFATLRQAIQEFSQTVESVPFVANRRRTSKADWQFAEIREMVLVPLRSSEHVFGWLAIFNNTEGNEFGSIEANLLASLGIILGIHSGNRDLYRQQAEFLADVVRALTSAIDAKDRYTCGHSDRVARVSVRLGMELGCDDDTLHRLYMAGLLHDIGKIGVDDAVLRKPGRLTDAEYEHIKLHPELGYQILADLKQLADVLPIVLHHHEQWDGKGYPHGLSGEGIPLLARIAAVADAYDAMTSDRPYRKGMPQEKVEMIFRDGSGVHWDPRVIDAFFACRDDILKIASHERANLSLDVQQWK